MNNTNRFCNLIAKESQADENGRQLVFADPITMAIISTIAQIAIREFLVPWLKRKCKERSENVIEKSSNPGFFYRFLVRRAVKKAAKGNKELAAENIELSKVERAIFHVTAQLSVEEFEGIIQEHS
jgi:hypothetical protein